MDDSFYSMQMLSAAAALVLLVANLVRKRSLFCLSSIALLYTFLAMAGSVVMVGMPRTGDSYVNPEAVWFLTLCYSVFCLPILFYKDGKDGREEGHSTALPISNCQSISLLLIVLTVPAAVYFAFRALPSLGVFLGSGVSREQFRMTVDLSKTATPVGALMSMCAVFSYCATFVAVYGLAFDGIGKWTALLLFFGGMANAISTLENVARSGLMEYGLMVFVVFLVMWPHMREGMRKRARRIIAVVGGLLLIPFLVLTVVRFASEDGGEGVGYSLFSYFATGPYSFSSDYTARVERGLPPTKGYLTNPYGLWLSDKVNGTADYAEASEEFGNRHLDNAPEYLEICNGYACEFKTIVGSFLMDYSPSTVFWCMLGIGVLFTALFRRSRNRPTDMVWASIYFFMVFMGPIGYAYATRYRTTMLLAFTLFAWLLITGELGNEVKVACGNGKGIGK